MEGGGRGTGSIVWGLSAALPVAALLWSLGVPSRLGLSLYPEQFLALVLGVSLALVFHLYPSRLRKLDYALSGVAFGASLWVAISYADIVVRQMMVPDDVLALAAILSVMVLEGLRRAAGWTLLVVVGLLVTIGLLGHLLPGDLQTRRVAPERMLVYLAFDSNGLLGITLAIAATIVITFVLFGQLLLRSGGGDFFNDIAMAIMGRRQGGAAKVAILGSGLFGSVNGVVVSNIVSTGVVTIRMMISSGFRPRQAAAIEATASTGGQIVPPVMGAVAFLMADFLQVPYTEVVLAAIVPAALYYIALYIQVHLLSGRERIAPLTEGLPLASQVLRRGWPFVLPFAVIIYVLFFAGQRPEIAAIWGAGAALAVGLAKGYRVRMKFSGIGDALFETGRSVVDIVLISAAAGLVIGVLNISGLGFALTYVLVGLGGGNLLPLLFIAALLCLVLGMGMPTVGVYLLLAVLVAPALITAGVDPMAAHFFIFYLGMMSMVTPPIAIGAFFAAMIAKAPPMRTAMESVRLGWTAYVVPFLFVFDTRLLLYGEPLAIAFALAKTTLGVALVSMAAIGWYRRPIAAHWRILIGLAGIVILLPVF